jgi:hypothetical protein
MAGGSESSVRDKKTIFTAEIAETAEKKIKSLCVLSVLCGKNK